MEEKRVPEGWGQLQMYVLFKKGDSQDPYNYRPISLVNVITKIFTQILSDRIYQWAPKANLLREAYFRKNR